MNLQKAGICALTTAAGLGAGIGAFAATSKASKKISEKTGKPVGCIGSYTHIMTNDKVENKKGALAEITKESLKDTGSLLGATGIGAGAAALVTGVSKKAQKGLNNFISNVGKSLDKISVPSNLIADSIEGIHAPETISLKDKVKLSGIGRKFLNATPAAKAAILTGAAILAVATPLVAINNAAKSGYIEAKHEVE
ncbi:TPA: hypothetical protein IAA82_03315 [Candidatus Galligastranaerophilus gallistercoris]|nr:hypothetical protein [Candidatus Galligastranaerophilus gallistercoris]